MLGGLRVCLVLNQSLHGTRRTVVQSRRLQHSEGQCTPLTQCRLVSANPTSLHSSSCCDTPVYKQAGHALIFHNAGACHRQDIIGFYDIKQCNSFCSKSKAGACVCKFACMFVNYLLSGMFGWGETCPIPTWLLQNLAQAQIIKCMYRCILFV